MALLPRLFVSMLFIFGTKLFLGINNIIFDTYWNLRSESKIEFEEGGKEVFSQRI